MWNAEMDYIIRDHSEAIMTARKATLAHAVKILNENTAAVPLNAPSATSISTWLKKSVPVCTLSTTRLKLQNPSGLCPKLHPSRRNRRSKAQLYGASCPNLGTGDFACHGPYEHVTVEGMEKCTELVLLLIDKYSKAAK